MSGAAGGLEFVAEGIVFIGGTEIAGGAVHQSGDVAVAVVTHEVRARIRAVMLPHA